MRLSSILISLAIAAAGCDMSGLAFRKDSRVEIVEPKSRARVTLPLTVKWVTQLDLGNSDGPALFGIFVDRAPMRPGQHLRELTDLVCKRTPGCPDDAYLKRLNIYVTAANAITLEALPDTRPSDRTGAKDSHEVTIVLIDARGRRVGESAYSVEFTVKRPKSERTS